MSEDDKNHFNNKEALNLLQEAECNFGDYQLYGKIQFVDSFTDIKIKVVESFPALNGKIIDSSPNECGVAG